MERSSEIDLDLAHRDCLPSLPCAGPGPAPCRAVFGQCEDCAGPINLLRARYGLCVYCAEERAVRG